MRIKQIAISLFAVFVFAMIAPQQSNAAPNCPPQYINICKQLIKTLEDNDDNGRYQYSWDGTHLTINGNFGAYTTLNNSASDTQHGRVATSFDQTYWGQDAFPSLLQQTIQASQGGQRVYLHLFQFGAPYKNAGLSNQTPSQPFTKNAQPSALKSLIPQGTAASNSPNAISVITGVKRHDGKKVDKHNVSQHFVTNKAGNQIEKDERSFLVDSNDKLWSCKISGLGARRMPNQNGAGMEVAGHVETLRFRSLHIAHIPGNHPMHSGCLISVQK